MELPVSRILPLGREGQQEIAGRLEARGFEDGLDLLVGGPRIGRRLEHDQLPGAQMARDVAGRAQDVAEVRLAVLAQGRGEADDDRRRSRASTDISAVAWKSAARPLAASRRATLGADVGDVRVALVESLDLGRVDIESDDGEAGFAEQQRQRQTDVPLSDNTHSGFVRRDPLSQFQSISSAGGLAHHDCLHKPFRRPAVPL